jgi:2-amino-4-hydroxy-6-hydroxymethyldihydropteridine diphosphokinase/dihydropteroate synthase
MKVTLGLGSNEGDRQNNLEAAVLKIGALKTRSSSTPLRISPLYETPALLPERAPGHWNTPFLNLAVELHLTDSPEANLRAFQQIELELGRGPHERWAPRLIDIDILFWGDQCVNSGDLTIPHPRMMERAFVLDPLKDLNPTAELLSRARKHPQHSPLWMGVMNVTPDSFSSEGLLEKIETSSPHSLRQDSPQGSATVTPANLNDRLNTILQNWDDHFVSIIDVGAESTRPGATPLTSQEEWHRLEPILHFLKNRYQRRVLKPLISVDTRFPETARKALELGTIDIVNDVSGLSDPKMLELLLESQNRNVQYVLMHSLSIPADGAKTLLDNCDPVAELLSWFEEKIVYLENAGIHSSRIILDPGIGFGKTAIQSLEILRNIDRFTKLPYRVLVGHSRKSFLNPWTRLPPMDRDLESIGVSLSLAAQGVDILRVHEPTKHIRAFRAGNHIHKSTPAFDSQQRSFK